VIAHWDEVEGRVRERGPMRLARVLSSLAYGTREPNDIAYYPETGEVWLRGVDVRLRTRWCRAGRPG
jgi:hypothetical protein